MRELAGCYHQPTLATQRLILISVFKTCPKRFTRKDTFCATAACIKYLDSVVTSVVGFGANKLSALVALCGRCFSTASCMNGMVSPVGRLSGVES